jgi:hypothetical protein
MICHDTSPLTIQVFDTQRRRIRRSHGPSFRVRDNAIESFFLGIDTARPEGFIFGGMRTPLGLGSIGELFLGDFVFLETHDIGAMSFEEDAKWAFALFLFGIAEWIEFVDTIYCCAQTSHIPAENEHFL